MKISGIAVAAVLMASSVLAEDAAISNAVEIRPSEHGRSWQVMQATDGCVSWVWPNGATAARIVVTSYVNKLRTKTFDVVREADAELGTLALPGAAEGTGEKLFDLVLTLFAGESELDVLTARVAVLPKSFDLQVPGSAAWKEVLADRIVPYDREWSEGGTEAALSLAAADKLAEIPLPGDSGFAPLCLKRNIGSYRGDFTASLSYDGAAEPLYAADLVADGWGLLMIMR